MKRPNSDRGSASIWVLTAAALMLVIAVGVVLRTGAVVARHRAEGAADAAALAAAIQIGTTGTMCAEAARVAGVNGSTLLDCTTVLAADGRSGTVAVAVGVAVRLPVLGAQTVRATARAGRGPPQ